MEEPGLRKVYDRIKTGDEDNAQAIAEERRKRIATSLRIRYDGYHTMQLYRNEALEDG